MGDGISVILAEHKLLPKADTSMQTHRLNTDRLQRRQEELVDCFAGKVTKQKTDVMQNETKIIKGFYNLPQHF